MIETPCSDHEDWLLGFFSLDIGIDLGTANTLVAIRDKGIVINEPSWVAINKHTTAAGHRRGSAEMVGTPGDIVAIRPHAAASSRFEITEAMLKAASSTKSHEQMLVPFPRPPRRRRRAQRRH